VLPSVDRLALLVGLLMGVAVLLLLRAGQVWQYRRGYGYSVYSAYTLRQRLLRWGLIALVAVLGFAGVYVWRITHPAANPISSADSPPADAVRDDIRLFIPTLDVEAPMIEAPFVARQWDISRLKSEVAHLAGTSYPGEPGNAVLAGHITVPGAGWGPFQELETLQPGDRIFIERGGTEFVYVVSENKVVEPEAVDVAYPTPDTRLTLITCTGWDAIFQTYSQRIVIVALLSQQ
jgi:LPXTG-site transpeptidase (sortase) family protein